MFSPQPGLPRRQMPYTPAALSVILSAACLMNSQVGFSGIVRPGLLHQVLAVHDEGALAIERRGVKLAVVGEAGANRR